MPSQSVQAVQQVFTVTPPFVGRTFLFSRCLSSECGESFPPPLPYPPRQFSLPVQVHTASTDAVPMGRDRYGPHTTGFGVQSANIFASRFQRINYPGGRFAGPMLNDTTTPCLVHATVGQVDLCFIPTSSFLFLHQPHAASFP